MQSQGNHKILRDFKCKHVWIHSRNMLVLFTQHSSPFLWFGWINSGNLELVWDPDMVHQVIVSFRAQWTEVSCDMTKAYQREWMAFSGESKEEGLSPFLAGLGFWRHAPIIAGNLLLPKGGSLPRTGQHRGEKRRGHRKTSLNDNLFKRLNPDIPELREPMDFSGI